MKRVDVTGEICPRPALIVRRELSDLDADETLVVEGDYPPAERNLRRSCETHGFEVRDADDRVEPGDDTFGLLITTASDETASDQNSSDETASDQNSSEEGASDEAVTPDAAED